MSENKEAQATTNASEEKTELTGAEKLYGADKTEVKASEPEKEVEAKVESEQSENKAPEEKNEGETSESSETKSEESKDAKAPEKYTFEVDDDSPLSDEHLDRIAAFAREQGLSQEAAQKLADSEAQLLSSFKSKLAEDFTEKTKSWKEAAQADKEIGGADFSRNVEIAKRVVDRFATPEFKKALNEMGFGDHPELLRTFVRIGQKMSEDELVLPSAQKTKPRDMADIFYGSKE